MLSLVVVGPLLAAMLLGCAGAAEPEPEPKPTRDEPRYSRSQASAAIRNHTYPCAELIVVNCGLRAKAGDPVNAKCASEDLDYEGRGIWECGSWTLDERTGNVFRNAR
jgi:hypothetical protein